MKQMRYRGMGTRTVTSDEFTAAGVKSKDITASQGEVIEMNDAAAAYFNEYEAADWQEISEREAARIAKEAEDRAEKAEAEARVIEQEAGIDASAE